MKKTFLLPLFAALASTTPLSAYAADWVVTKVSQPSNYTEDLKNWKPLAPGMTVKNQSWISTGPRGRVVLERAKDKVTFQPNTLAGVFERAGAAIHTDFAQQTGQIRLEIDPKKKPHLAVQTPFLAAVVKGTVFTVTVEKTGAQVGVERGRVEVTDALSGERTGVKAGQQASVDDNPETSMALSGTNTDFEPVVSTKPFSPAVPSQSPASATSAGTTKAAPATNSATNEDAGTEDGGTKADTGKNGDGKGSGKGGDGAGSGKGGSGKGGDGKGGSGKGDDGKDGDGKGGSGKGGDGKSGDGKDGSGKGGDGKHGEGKDTGSSGGGDDSGDKGKSGDGESKGPGKGGDSDGKSGKDKSGDDSGDDGEKGKGDSGGRDKDKEKEGEKGSDRQR